MSQLGQKQKWLSPEWHVGSSPNNGDLAAVAACRFCARSGSNRSYERATRFRGRKGIVASFGCNW